MSIPHRNSDPANVAAGARTFLGTASTWGKRSLLQSARAAELLISTLYDYRAQGKYDLHEFVVMPDHFHVLLTVRTGITIERAVQYIKGGFAFRAGRELGFKAPVWQKGFSEVRVLDSSAYENQRAYIRANPVAAHLTGTAQEYPYSSANDGFELDPAPQRLKPEILIAWCGTPEGVP